MSVQQTCANGPGTWAPRFATTPVPASTPLTTIAASPTTAPVVPPGGPTVANVINDGNDDALCRDDDQRLSTTSYSCRFGTHSVWQMVSPTTLQCLAVTAGTNIATGSTTFVAAYYR